MPQCDDSCSHARDGTCNDGGGASESALCDSCSDCTDCGNCSPVPCGSTFYIMQPYGMLCPREELIGTWQACKKAARELGYNQHFAQGYSANYAPACSILVSYPHFNANMMSDRSYSGSAPICKRTVRSHCIAPPSPPPLSLIHI